MTIHYAIYLMRATRRALVIAAVVTVLACSAAAQSANGRPDASSSPDPGLRTQDAYLIHMSENWEFTGDLPEHSLVLSLQGLANRESPNVYLEYGPSWTWRITGPLREFYERKHGFVFKTLDTTEDAVAALAKYAKGYVVWDKEVRTSLIVAFTAAGVEDLAVVNEDLIPLVEKYGLKKVVDLRNEFRGMPDHEIYQIAFDRYWDRCSRDVVIWMGGAAGKIMEPGMADWGIYKRAFFSDLSNNPRHPEELALANRIYSEQNPQSFVMGWHSYAKDTEGQMTSLVSQYGLRMEGLNTLPNLSFNDHVGFSDGFEFKNHHNVTRDEVVVPEDKVYIALSQTDGMGIGAWTMPGRGKLPYAWATQLSWVDFSPAALEYFFESATPNDLIIGYAYPSYMYPKPVPIDAYPKLQEETRRYMKTLDLTVMDIMDYSEGNRHVGNQDVPKDLVERIFDGYPDVIGFTNGYGAARTFDLIDGRAIISYDYYLGSGRKKEEAVADLKELMSLNKKRPYYLLIHVRQTSTIDEVAEIMEELGDGVEVVPLDKFLKLAAAKKTYVTRYLQPDDPVVRNPH